MKATSPSLPPSLPDVPGLWMVESVDSVKCARVLERWWEGREERLRVLIQVNTSYEDSECREGGW